MWAMQPYTARAFFGATPAYRDWKLNTRASSSSPSRASTRRPSDPKAPSCARWPRSPAAPASPIMSSGESKLADMKCGYAEANIFASHSRISR